MRQTAIEAFDPAVRVRHRLVGPNSSDSCWADMSPLFFLGLWLEGGLDLALEQTQSVDQCSVLGDHDQATGQGEIAIAGQDIHN